jgi:hypothetical protein
MTGTSGLENQCEIWDPLLPLSEKIKQVLAENHPAENRLEELEEEFGVEKLKAVLEAIGF